MVPVDVPGATIGRHSASHGIGTWRKGRPGLGQQVFYGIDHAHAARLGERRPIGPRSQVGREGSAVEAILLGADHPE